MTPTLSVPQIAQRYNVHPKTVRKAIRSKKLHAVKPGAHYRIEEADAQAWIEATVPQVEAGRKRPLPKVRSRLPSLVAIDGGGSS